MYEEPKFFVCEVCGNLVGMIHSSGVPMMCCGKKMTELKANTSDGCLLYTSMCIRDRCLMESRQLNMD